jgi:hypothetical protein
MELWRDCTVEMIHLVAHNTWQRFQESKEAAAANEQLHFCEQFDNMNADEQRAVLQRIRLQFGEGAAGTGEDERTGATIAQGNLTHILVGK